MSNNEVTLHLDIVGRTLAGTIFGNQEEHVIVLRWEDLSDFAEAGLLVEMLRNELDGCGAQTLFFDSRRVAAQEGSAFDATLRRDAIAHPAIQQVAWLVANPEVAMPAAVEQLHVNRNIDSCVATSFVDATRVLTDGRMYFCRDWKTEDGISEFEATYGGSTYFLPELKTTVQRSSGNYFDLAAAQDVYERSFRLHARCQGSAFILDTSSVAPIEDIERYTFAFKALIHPIIANCDIQQLIHMRVGDPIFPPGAQTPQQLAATMRDVHFVETSSLAESKRVIRTTRGLAKPSGQTAEAASGR